jgi:hypothetical protein
MRYDAGAALMLLGCLAIAGCSNRESRVVAPVMDPVAMTEQCFELVDADKDGQLTKRELKATPGLLSALVDLDVNKDDQLSREEILSRFQLYVDSQVGLQGFNCTVTMNGRPLRDGHVELIPEPFMAEFIEPAAGDVINTSTGMAEVSTDPELPGVRPGIYRVEITSPTVEISPRYNTETIYGVEVAPVQQEAPNRNFPVKRR